MLTKVTLDTNVSPPETVISSVPAGQFDFVVVSVTDRETAGTSFQVRFSGVGRVLETAVLDESTYGGAVYGSTEDADCQKQCCRSSPTRGSRSSVNGTL